MDTTPLNLDRFQELADAYGGDLQRWPAAERAGAAALMAADGAPARAILSEAARLDALLSSSRIAAPSPALVQAVIAAAPRPRAAPARRRWAAVAIGSTLAAASVAGLLSGLAAAPAALPRLHQTTLADTTGEAARWLVEPS